MVNLTSLPLSCALITGVMPFMVTGSSANLTRVHAAWALTDSAPSASDAAGTRSHRRIEPCFARLAMIIAPRWTLFDLSLHGTQGSVKGQGPLSFGCRAVGRAAAMARCRSVCTARQFSGQAFPRRQCRIGLSRFYSFWILRLHVRRA